MWFSTEPQIIWQNFLESTQVEEKTLYIYGTYIFTTIVYWVIGGIYTFADVTNKPAVLRRYKVQPGTNEPVDTWKLIKVAGVVLFNQSFVGIPFIYTFYLALKWRGHAPIHKLPTFNSILIELIVFILMEEIFFYYSHRLLHNRYLYQYIHKQHHEWTSPISITAIYCHPIEYAFADLFPVYSGVFIMGSHMVTMWIWATIAIMGVLSDHSGYHFPFSRSPRFHDFHHLKFNQCYGLLGILDRLHGTDKLFRKSESYKHHTMLLSFKPIKESNFEK